MDNSLLAVRDINHKYIVVEEKKEAEEDRGTGEETKHDIKKASKEEINEIISNIPPVSQTPIRNTQYTTTIDLNIRRLINQPINISSDLSMDKIIKILTDSLLDEEQINAILGCLSSSVSLITGKAGTGKSTTVKGLIDAYQHIYPERKVVLVAPTGTAASNLSRKTRYPATTIHNAFTIVPNKRDILVSYAKCLENALVVVDEASMLDDEVLSILLTKLQEEKHTPLTNQKGCQIVFVGDSFQLKSVGEGEPFKRLIDSGEIPVHELTTIHRTSNQSGILRFASLIREGSSESFGFDDSVNISAYKTNPYRLDDLLYVEDQLVNKALANIKEYGLMESIVLCPENGKTCGVYSVNKRLQAELNPDGTGFAVDNGLFIMPGDPVMHLKNNHKTGIMNGSIGVCISSSEDSAICEYENAGGETIRIDYKKGDENLVTLAYALTVHKSQGHEWKCVTFSIMGYQTYSQNRSLLYTAVTRASDRFFLFSDTKGITATLKDTGLRTPISRQAS